MLLSGVTGQGVPEVLRALQSMINSPARAERTQRATGGGRCRMQPLRSQPSPGTQGEGEIGVGHDPLPRLRPAPGGEDRQRPGGGPGRGRAPHRLAGRRRRRHRLAAHAGRRCDRRLLRRHRAGPPLAWRCTQRRLRLEEQQAAAAVGQIRLAQAWSEALSAKGLTAAQLLLTLDDTEDRRRYLNARATLSTLLGLGCIPVINENDTVATAEIRFGDNDRLAARVAEMIQADQLCCCPTSTASTPPTRAATLPPRTSRWCRRSRPRSRRWAASRRPATRPAACAPSWSPRASPPRPAARWRSRYGHADRPLAALEKGARCTWFLAAPEGRSARKRWIAGALAPLGALVVDAGAARALAGGRSLLPAGVRGVEGTFERGDPVVVRGPDGKALARGLSAYASADAERIAGHRSDEIEAILGWRGRDEIIHRDDLVLL